MFTEQINAGAFQSERRRTRPATLSVDIGIALLLVVDGVLLAALRPLAAVLTFGLAVGLALTSMVVEPATVTAAFPRR